MNYSHPWLQRLYELGLCPPPPDLTDDVQLAELRHIRAALSFYSFAMFMFLLGLSLGFVAGLSCGITVASDVIVLHERLK